MVSSLVCWTRKDYLTVFWWNDLQLHWCRLISLGNWPHLYIHLEGLCPLPCFGLSHRTLLSLANLNISHSRKLRVLIQKPLDYIRYQYIKCKNYNQCVNFLKLTKINRKERNDTVQSSSKSVIGALGLSVLWMLYSTDAQVCHERWVFAHSLLPSSLILYTFWYHIVICKCVGSHTWLLWDACSPLMRVQHICYIT